jgi:hypothetical protein
MHAPLKAYAYFSRQSPCCAPSGKQAFSFFSETVSVKKEMGEYNEAEWLVDIITEADRNGKGGEIAALYNNSIVKAVSAASTLASLKYWYIITSTGTSSRVLHLSTGTSSQVLHSSTGISSQVLHSTTGR